MPRQIENANTMSEHTDAYSEFGQDMAQYISKLGYPCSYSAIGYENNKERIDAMKGKEKSFWRNCPDFALKLASGALFTFDYKTVTRSTGNLAINASEYLIQRRLSTYYYTIHESGEILFYLGRSLSPLPVKIICPGASAGNWVNFLHEAVADNIALGDTELAIDIVVTESNRGSGLPYVLISPGQCECLTYDEMISRIIAAA